MTDWNDPVIQGAEREMDRIDGLPICLGCFKWKAAPDDTLCQWCRAGHPRQFDPRLTNISFQPDPRD